MTIGQQRICGLFFNSGLSLRTTMNDNNLQQIKRAPRESKLNRGVNSIHISGWSHQKHG